MRDMAGFRKYLDVNGIRTRINLDNKASFYEACERNSKMYEELYGKYLPENKEVKILDVGSGFGWFLHYLNSKGYYRIMGVEIDEYKVKTARKFGIEIKRTSIYDFFMLNLLRERYDLIFMLYILEHMTIPEVEEILSMAYKSMSQRGRIVVSVPNMESPFNLRLRYIDVTHQIGFTASSLLYILYQAGFDDLKISEDVIIPEDKKRMYRKYKKIIQGMCHNLCVRSPLFFSEGLICTGVKK